MSSRCLLFLYHITNRFPPETDGVPAPLLQIRTISACLPARLLQHRNRRAFLSRFSPVTLGTGFAYI